MPRSKFRFGWMLAGITRATVRMHPVGKHPVKSRGAGAGRAAIALMTGSTHATNILPRKHFLFICIFSYDLLDWNWN